MMSDDGYITGALGTMSGPPTSYVMYFVTSDNQVIGNFTLDSTCDLLSMSGDGRITAVSGPDWDSLYVFIKTDVIETPAPPPIGGEILPPAILQLTMLIALIAILGSGIIFNKKAIIRGKN
jgi:hypothetical protein